MKNLPGSKIKVVPASPDYASVLKLLPEDVTELASSLVPEDLEILAYFIACSSETRASAQHCKRSKKSQCASGGPCLKPLYNRVSIQISEDTSKLLQTSSPVFNVAVQLRKPALFECNCFQCYTSYWSRWDASANRGKIDEAISLYEEHINNRKTQRKAKGGASEKSDKKSEGRGRGRRGGHEKQLKQKESKFEVPVGGSSRDKKRVGPILAIEEQDLPVDGGKLQQRKDVSKVVKNGGKVLSGDNNETKGESAPSKSAPSKVPVVKNQGKEKASLKESRVKSNRVAPFVGEAVDTLVNLDEDSEEIPSSEELDTKEDPSALHRGKKLVSFVANRLWGFWDRRTPDRIVDVY